MRYLPYLVSLCEIHMFFLIRRLWLKATTHGPTILSLESEEEKARQFALLLHPHHIPRKKDKEEKSPAVEREI